MTPVVLAILILNALVFVAWIVLGPVPVMTDNFLVSWAALEAGRYWTLLGSAFSHMGGFHFLINMYVLATFGSFVEQVIGSWRFAVFYLLAALVGSLGHAGVSAFLLDKPDLPALGASGAVSGVVILFSLMMPRAALLLLGLIPMPALVGALIFVGLDVVGLVAQTEGGGLPIGHGAHLGGAAMGALFYVTVARHIPVPMRRHMNYSDAEAWRSLFRRSGFDGKS